MQYTREPGGAACPNFGAVWTVPPNIQPEHFLSTFLVSTFYIFVSFLSVKRPKGKDKWPKTDEKTRFGGTLGFFLL